MAFIYPVNAPISQRYGINPAPYQPNGHYGIDFACATGTDIRSLGDGVVRWADWNQNLGVNPWMVVPHATGSGIFVAIDHGGYVSLYCHLSATNMNIGDRVTAGTIIGQSGSTGNSTGPHLHLETILMRDVNGYNYGRVDPASLMSGFAPVGSTMVAENQRMVGPSNLNQRSEPRTDASVVRVVPANTVETFSGYVIGESVTVAGEAGVRAAVTSNIWYKDNEGYVWAGGFTEQKTSGLSDLTPKAAPLAANQRTAGPSSLNQRSEPRTNAPVVRTIDANTVETFDGYAIGETVTVAGEAGVRTAVSSNIWYKDSLGYVWAGGFTTQSTNGLANLSPQLAANQRKVGGSGATQRSTPATSGSVVRSIEANTVETFSGYVVGEDVNTGGIQSDIWYKDNAGYVWAGVFTTQSTDGLPNQTPATSPAKVSKTVVAEGVRLRDHPSMAGTIQRVIEGGTTVEPSAYIESDSAISDSKVWFVLADGYIHSSGVTDASLGGLNRQGAPTTPPVSAEPPYGFVPDFDFVEYEPANTWNMQNGNFPANPEKIVLHQFDAKALKPSLNGVIDHFQNPRPKKPSSAHFAVSGKRIVQLVSLKDRAMHAGPVGNDYIGIEVDPQEDPDTVASVKKLILALNQKYGKVFKYAKHRDVPENATECGVDIHLEKYTVNTHPTPAPAPAPAPVPVSAQPEPTKEQIQFVLDHLRRIHSE